MDHQHHHNQYQPHHHSNRQMNTMSNVGHFQSGPPHMQAANPLHHHPSQPSMHHQQSQITRRPTTGGGTGGGMGMGATGNRHVPLGAAGDSHHTRPPMQQVGPGGPAGQNVQQAKDLPLRMVVDAKYVGAIIGQGGANIRDITKESKARCVVDVQRAMRDSVGNLEKVISILGQPENCSKACIKVLEVIRRESEKDAASTINPNEYELKLRAHNQLVGRLIGKGGATIKKMMEETGATVFVSNEPSSPTRAETMGSLPPFIGMYADLSQMPPMERTITIRAPTMAILSLTEQRISAKLRQSYETDLANRPVYPHAMPGTAMAAALGGSLLPFNVGGDPYGLGGGMMGSGRQALSASQMPNKIVHMWVPNNMVGALIGSKGAHIRQVMRVTGAHIRIEGGPNNNNTTSTTNSNSQQSAKEKLTADDSGKDNEMITDGDDNTTGSPRKTTPNGTIEKSDGTAAVSGGGSPSPSSTSQQNNTIGAAGGGGVNSGNHPEERLVTITGNDPQQYKAQFWIYQRVAEQGYHFVDEVRLCTEISVPSKLVGRIIGKGGQNVRELQRVTGAQVKIPEECETSGASDHDETVVRIAGNFQASQAVQCRIAQMVHQFQQHSVMPIGGGHTGGGGGLNSAARA